ncbi:MAG TPA: hypothetical protein ACFYD6_06430 [Candidatus Brocadiia bacterium]|nr:hypothetical protein [Planctomycetota bacterium]MBI4007921.1 hypothetical protein [Planctomycetota bacterium]MDO8094597.1 hypothetical protein [Candidatus Brocadiales bacterium]
MCRIISILFISFLFFVPYNHAHAVWLNLTEEQTKQAVEYGKANKNTNVLEFFDEWVVVREESGIERVGINTKFSIVAFVAREAAIQNKELTPKEIEEKTAAVNGLLSFQAVLYGPSADFAKYLDVALEYKGQYILPVRKHNQQRAQPRGWWPGKPPLFCAICEYDFPDYFVDPRHIVTLVILSEFEPDRRFVFDLSRMR